jgi:exosortase K
MADTHGRFRQVCWWGMVLGAAFVLKYHYSVASASELQWILAPLPLMTQIFSAMSFTLNDAGEWVNAGYNVVIAKSCAGVNFMILSLLVCAGRFYPVSRRYNVFVSCLGFITLCLLVAWSITVMVNTLRILIAIQLYIHEVNVFGLSPGQIHRLAGILIFLPALWLQLKVASRLKVFTAGMVATGLYLSFVIGVPLVTGNYKLNPDMFIEQTWFIVASTVVIFLVLLVIKGINKLLKSIMGEPLPCFHYTVLRPVRFNWPGK